MLKLVLDLPTRPAGHKTAAAGLAGAVASRTAGTGMGFVRAR